MEGEAELGAAGTAPARTAEQRRKYVGEMALEGFRPVSLPGVPNQTRGFCLGAIHDRGAHVGLEGEVDVHHAQLVAVAAGGAR